MNTPSRSRLIQALVVALSVALCAGAAWLWFGGFGSAQQGRDTIAALDAQLASHSPSPVVVLVSGVAGAVDAAGLSRALGHPEGVALATMPDTSPLAWYVTLQQWVYTQGHAPDLVIVAAPSGAFWRAPQPAEREWLTQLPASVDPLVDAHLAQAPAEMDIEHTMLPALVALVQAHGGELVFARTPADPEADASQWEGSDEGLQSWARQQRSAYLRLPALDLDPNAFGADGQLTPASAKRWTSAMGRQVIAGLEKRAAGQQSWTTRQGDIQVSEAGRFSLRAADPELEALQAIGYVSGSEEPRATSGVVVHQRDRVEPGLNLVTSGHGPEAFLMDMDGEPLHTWRLPYAEALPGCRCANQSYWRRVGLLPEGELLAIFDGCGLVRIDRDSTLQWAQCNGAHHDLEVLDNGQIWVLTRTARRDDPDQAPVLEDFATLLDADGRVVRSISILEAYRNSPFTRHFERAERKGGDIFHTNSLEVLDGAAAGVATEFTAGRLLLSMRHLSTLAVLDPDTEAIVWSEKGPWRMQHDPHVVADAGLLFFDNRGLEDRSRVVELDLATGSSRWTWPDDAVLGLDSRTCGLVQRLNNGHTVITESDGGRALEIDTDGEVVWAWNNPHRPADNPDFVATLFELERVTPDRVSWLPDLP